MEHHETITSLFQFQYGYLKQLTANIPSERLYELQLEGYNSAGWVLGHLFVEGEDIYRHMGWPLVGTNDWNGWFRNTTGKIESLDGLPSKKQLLEALDLRYRDLVSRYVLLTEEERAASHPSTMLNTVLPTLGAWFAHHLTTHFSIHCGNLVVWKKMVGIPVEGY